jgi:hypothetical protein
LRHACTYGYYDIVSHIRNTYKEHDHTCSICLESDQDSDNIMCNTACKHTFHYTCLSSYSRSIYEQKHKQGTFFSCPLCRHSIRMDQQGNPLFYDISYYLIKNKDYILIDKIYDALKHNHTDKARIISKQLYNHS